MNPCYQSLQCFAIAAHKKTVLLRLHESVSAFSFSPNFFFLWIGCIKTYWEPSCGTAWKERHMRITQTHSIIIKCWFYFWSFFVVLSFFFQSRLIILTKLQHIPYFSNWRCVCCYSRLAVEGKVVRCSGQVKS